MCPTCLKQKTTAMRIEAAALSDVSTSASGQPRETCCQSHLQISIRATTRKELSVTLADHHQGDHKKGVAGHTCRSASGQPQESCCQSHLQMSIRVTTRKVLSITLADQHQGDHKKGVAGHTCRSTSG